jgi:hypothetical protein
MRKIYFVLVFLLIVSHAQADNSCSQEGLTKYDLVLTINETQVTYSAIIFLPNFASVKGEFCGFWLHKELTNNMKHRYYGYKDSNSYISLNPEISDTGLSINLASTNRWVQQGNLGKESFAGVTPVGNYSISTIKSHNKTSNPTP